MEKISKIRIAKFIASTQICSRREAEKLIINGDVTVNGEKVIHPLFFVTNKDLINVKGKLLKKQSKIRLFIYNKSINLITSHKDPEGRPTVFDKIPKKLGRLISIGRRDFNTEGLLLLTNNGDLKRYLELPSNNIKRSYKVKVIGDIDNLKIEEIRKGISINKVHYAPIKLKIISKTKNTTWIELQLTEGKNREIRKIIQYYNLKISRLIRISYGQFYLNDLKKNEVIEVNKSKMNNLISILEKDKLC